MTRKSSKRQYRAGFTLIELLVVVAIIALLISILLPSLRAAREKGRAVVCASDLTQVGKGILLYAQDNDKWLPHMGYRQAGINWFWATQIPKYIANKFSLYVCPSDEDPTPYGVKVESKKVTFYSNTKPPYPQGVVSMPVTYNGSCELLYNANPWELIRWGRSTSAFSSQRKYVFRNASGVTQTLTSDFARLITDFKRPSTTFVFVEGKDIDSSSDCFRVDRLQVIATAPAKGSAATTLAAYQSWLRHAGRTNILYLDNHVATHTPGEIATRIWRQQEFYRVNFEPR